MSGSMTRRSALADIAARPLPAFQAPMQRNRGNSWNYPGFGRDPELAPPPPSAPSTPATPRAEELVAAPAQAASAVIGGSSDGGGGGDSFSISADMAANPEAYRNTVLEDVARGMLQAVGLGSLSPTATTITADRSAISAAPPGVTEALMSGQMGMLSTPEPTVADISPTAVSTEALGSPVADNNPHDGSGGFSDPNSRDAVSSMNDAISAGLGPESPGWGAPSNTETTNTDTTTSDTTTSDTTSSESISSDSPSSDSPSSSDSSSSDAGGDGDGYMVGGYTGAGADGIVNPAEPAGTVHEGEVVIPAHKVAKYGVEPLMHLAGPGAKMGSMPALGMIHAAGTPPMEDASVPSFQTPSRMSGSAPPGAHGAPAADHGGFQMARPTDGFVEGMGPYQQEGAYADPFRAPDESQGATGSTAMQQLGQLPPHAQSAVLQVLGSDPMASSALLQVLGPSFRDLIAEALKAHAPPPTPGMPPDMMGGAPPAMV
jgi:hypothetical protein